MACKSVLAFSSSIEHTRERRKGCNAPWGGRYQGKWEREKRFLSSSSQWCQERSSLKRIGNVRCGGYCNSWAILEREPVKSTNNFMGRHFLVCIFFSPFLASCKLLWTFLFGAARRINSFDTWLTWFPRSLWQMMPGERCKRHRNGWFFLHCFLFPWRVCSAKRERDTLDLC